MEVLGEYLPSEMSHDERLAAEVPDMTVAASCVADVACVLEMFGL